MKSKKQVMVISILLTLAMPTFANDVVTALLQEFQNQATRPFSAEAGQQLWMQTYSDDHGKTRSCTNCHSNDPKQAGKHMRTGKIIKPLAPSVNEESLSTTNNIQKWLKRNCKWTLGRECTAQEKGDILTYLNSK